MKVLPAPIRDILVRATVVDAQNSGAVPRYTTNRLEFARVIERETACPICSSVKEMIVWLEDPMLRPVVPTNQPVTVSLNYLFGAFLLTAQPQTGVP